jgi:exopolyphosphatase / guanosine-5'-triphosphate,3'-diphosphate pyrophosphatase
VRVACIDIGTNTTRLLVAEPDGDGLREVAVMRSFTGLGHVRRNGAIDAHSIADVAEAVAVQVRGARDAGAAVVRVVATGAVREAVNGGELLAAVLGAAGTAPDVLSGEEEARLAFVGATAGTGLLPDQRVGVVDVGGGSTELVIGTPAGGVDWSVSLPIGSAVLAEHCVLSDPPTPAQLEAARAHIAMRFASLAPPPCATALAVGGSATSLGRLAGALLDAAVLERVLARLCSGPCEQLAVRLGLDARRVRLLPAGIIVLERAAQTIGCPLRIGGGGLREGVVLEALGLPRA